MSFCAPTRVAALQKTARPSARPSASHARTSILRSPSSARKVYSLVCHSTSLPERMGEQTPVDLDTHFTAEELQRLEQERRQQEAAAQQQAVQLLRELEAAAVASNPEAGHPELRRALTAADYSPQDATASKWVRSS